MFLSVHSGWFGTTLAQSLILFGSCSCQHGGTLSRRRVWNPLFGRWRTNLHNETSFGFTHFSLQETPQANQCREGTTMQDLPSSHRGDVPLPSGGFKRRALHWIPFLWVSPRYVFQSPPTVVVSLFVIEHVIRPP